MKRVTLFTAIAALLLTAFAYSQPMEMGRMADKLKLTDQQIEQFENLHLKLQRDMVKPESDLRLARLDMKEILMHSPIDEKAALGKQDQISSIKADMAKLRLQHIMSAAKILTPDQLAQWKKMHREMGRGGHRGMGHNGPWGGMMGRGMMGGGMMGPGMIHHEQEQENQEKEQSK